MQAHSELKVMAPLGTRPDIEAGAKSWQRRFGTRTTLGGWSAAIVAGLALGAVNAAVIVWWLPSSLDRSLRLQHLLIDAAQSLSFACLLGVALLAYQRALRPWLFRRASWSQKRWLARWLSWTALGSVLTLVLLATLRDDFLEFAHRTSDPRLAPLLATGMSTACALVLAAGLVLLTRWWRRWLACVAVIGSLGLLFANHLVLANNYAGVHFFLALTGLSTLVAALKPWRCRRGPPGLWQRTSIALAPMLCLPLALVEPSQTLLSEQMKLDGSVVAGRVSALRHWLNQLAGSDTSAAAPDWLARHRRTPVPSSHPDLLPAKPLILMVTIDAVRSDVLDNPEFVERLPNLHALKRRSVYFSEARAPGSQTVTSLSGVFSGLYFSQQYWTRHPEVGHLFLGDDLPRVSRNCCNTLASRRSPSLPPTFW